LIRRQLLGAAAASVASAPALVVSTRTEALVKRINFVLVHRAWLGAWCWRHVTAARLKQGHQVYTPTLTGTGDQHHLSTPNVDSYTHMKDVTAVIETEELNEVVLVGNSYAGCPCAAVR